MYFLVTNVAAWACRRPVHGRSPEESAHDVCETLAGPAAEVARIMAPIEPRF
jgi:hypothetical protein